MKSNKNTVLATGAIVLSMSMLSNAGLYVSPSKSIPPSNIVGNLFEGSTLTEFAEIVTKEQEMSLKEKIVPVEHKARQGKDIEHEAIQEVAEETNPISFGSNVPLSIVLAEFVPKDVAIYMDEGLEDSLVSWKDSSNWRDVILSISNRNPISIQYNEKHNRMGISEVMEISSMMANTNPGLYYLSTDRSIRNNLELWAGLHGWELAWDVNFDLPVTHPAFFKGEFKEVINEFIEALSSNTKPLSAILHTKNNVIQIVNGGFRRGES
jgi:hypothetical protein